MLIYWLFRIAIYVFFGLLAVYIVEKMKEKPMSLEWRVLTCLTGPTGFGLALVFYLVFSLIKNK